jgi:hypothetical protein
MERFHLREAQCSSTRASKHGGRNKPLRPWQRPNVVNADCKSPQLLDRRRQLLVCSADDSARLAREQHNRAQVWVALFHARRHIALKDTRKLLTNHVQQRRRKSVVGYALQRPYDLTHELHLETECVQMGLCEGRAGDERCKHRVETTSNQTWTELYRLCSSRVWSMSARVPALALMATLTTVYKAHASAKTTHVPRSRP